LQGLHAGELEWCCDRLQRNIVAVEGNAYFPPEAIDPACFQPSDHRSVCGWGRGPLLRRGGERCRERQCRLVLP